MFTYAIKTKGQVTAKTLKGAGLDKIIGMAPTRCAITRGPWGNGPGHLITFGKGFPKLEQTNWNKSVNGKFWIGYNELPTELELRRKSQLPGHNVNINNQQWTIPVARMAGGYSALPIQKILDSDYNVIDTKTLSEYRDFAELSESLWTDFCSETKAAAEKRDYEWEISEPERMKIIVMALNYNYHVGIDEINALGLLDNITIKEIQYAVIDIPTLMAVSEDLKKKE